MRFEVAFLRERLAALWTFKRFFASVCSHVGFQMGSLRKLFAASFNTAIKLPKIGVHKHVPSDISKMGEPL